MQVTALKFNRRTFMALALGGVFATGGLAFQAQAVPAGGKAGGTMVVALPGDPPVINSTVTTDISSSNLSGQVYSTIVRLDQDGNVQPYLAESWDITPDGLTYTFRFPSTIKWHDGTPFTAEDVAWGLWNVNRKYNGPASGLLEAVESITAPDARTAVFKLKYPYPPLLRGLAYFNSSTIIPKHIFDNGQDPRNNPANLKPIGTGPFVFKEYRKGSHHHLREVRGLSPEGAAVPRQAGVPDHPERGRAGDLAGEGRHRFHSLSRDASRRGGPVEGIEERHGCVPEAGHRRSVPGVRQHAGGAAGEEGSPTGPVRCHEPARHAREGGLRLRQGVLGGPISSEQPIFYTENVPQYPYRSRPGGEDCSMRPAIRGRRMASGSRCG